MTAPPPVPAPRRSGRRTTRLVDIAEAVGVHTSTVSRVLNGDPAQSVRPEIYEKIWRTYRYLVDESRADGLLLATSLRIPAHTEGSAEGLLAVPRVYVNRRGPERGNDVVMDEPAAVRLFLDHVAALGHQRVALIDGPVEVDTVHRRELAARRACAARDLQLTAAWPCPWPSWAAPPSTP